MKQLALALALLLAAPAAQAHDVITSGLHFVHPYVSEPIKGAMAGAAYVVIANEGTAADTLIGVETDIAMMAMMHKTEFSANGVASMVELPPVTIAPGDVYSFEPGGAHIMLMMIDSGLKVGDMVPFTLIFQNAGRIEVEFMVDPADPNAPAAEHMH
ncbi:MAG: copper chaperone PCu(A)C [Rhodobacteraceae bacterium]|nr:copper chaperone PCu(A)C [Paracoccaceae bacterium]